MVIKKGVEVSRLSGAESVVGQRGKFESYALLNRKPIYLRIPDECVSWESMTGNNSGKCVLDAL